MQAPNNIVNYRREKCRACKTPCQFQNDVAFRSEGDNACPSNKWMDHKLFVKTNPKGAGDVVAMFAQPIAGAIDKVFKTNVRKCSACAKRKEMLNMYLPFGQKDVK